MTKRSHSLRQATSLTQARKRATALASRGKYRSAADCLKHALNRSTEVSAEKLALWNELGMLCKYSGEFDEAEQCYRFALKSSVHCYQGQQLQFFQANLYHNLGGLEHSRRRYRVGERYTRKALELRCQASDRSSLGVASDMAALAALLDGQQRFAESEALYRKALRIYRSEYGKSHPEIAVMLNNLASVFQATSRESAARRFYQAALAMKRKQLCRSHPDVAITLNNIAMLAKRSGNTNEARTYLEAALAIFQKSLGNAHPNARAVRRNLEQLGSGKKH